MSKQSRNKNGYRRQILVNLSASQPNSQLLRTTFPPPTSFFRIEIHNYYANLLLTTKLSFIKSNYIYTFNYIFRKTSNTNLQPPCGFVFLSPFLNAAFSLFSLRYVLNFLSRICDFYDFHHA